MANERTMLLKQMPVFGGLSDNALQLILAHSEICHVIGNDYFFHENDAADALYVLEDGSVIVEKSWQGNPITMCRFAAGDCFGEMSLIDLQPRSASVRAETDCQAIKISIRLLHDLFCHDLEQYSIIMMNLGREVSRRLRQTSEELFSLQQNASDD